MLTNADVSWRQPSAQPAWVSVGYSACLNSCAESTFNASCQSSLDKTAVLAASPAAMEAVVAAVSAGPSGLIGAHDILSIHFPSCQKVLLLLVIA